MDDERYDYQQQLADAEREQIEQQQARWAEALAMDAALEAHRRWIEDWRNAGAS